MATNTSKLSGKAETALSVTDFTNVAQPLLMVLEEVYPTSNGFLDVNLSDVRDKLGRQYVDLVQEGGGVHGIALAGYTYILEKAGVAFCKMAGTSAGSINTLLLSAVATKAELQAMQANPNKLAGLNKREPDQLFEPGELNADDYFETRSEKVLQCLANKQLRELVDSDPRPWRPLLLKLFTGKVDFVLIKKWLARTKLAVILFALLAVITSVLFLINQAKYNRVGLPIGAGWQLLPWMLLVIGGLLLLGGLLVFLITRKTKGLGINVGQDFENWMAGIATKNGIGNISRLKNKLELERMVLAPRYEPKLTDLSTSILDAGHTRSLLGAEIDKVGQLNPADDSALKNCMDEIELINTKLIQNVSGALNEENQEEVIAYVQLFSRLITQSIRLENECQTAEDVKSTLDKEIALVASDISNGIKVELPAMHKMYWGSDYTISPAKYVRASMSVPAFFKAYKISFSPAEKDTINAAWKNLGAVSKDITREPTSAVLVDGGMLSNFPINVFYNSQAAIPSKPTLGIKLQFEDDSRGSRIDNFRDFGSGLLSTMRFFYDREFLTKHSIFKSTVRSIDTGGIHWLNFSLTAKEQIELFFRGALAAAIFLCSDPRRPDAKAKIAVLNSLGSEITYGDKVFSIYSGKATSVRIESGPDFDFNWEDYKVNRLKSVVEAKRRLRDLKRSASYSATTAVTAGNK